MNHHLILPSYLDLLFTLSWYLSSLVRSPPLTLEVISSSSCEASTSRIISTQVNKYRLPSPVYLYPRECSCISSWMNDSSSVNSLPVLRLLRFPQNLHLVQTTYPYRCTGRSLASSLRQPKRRSFHGDPLHL